MNKLLQLHNRSKLYKLVARKLADSNRINPLLNAYCYYFSSLLFIQVTLDGYRLSEMIGLGSGNLLQDCRIVDIVATFSIKQRHLINLSLINDKEKSR